MDSFRGAKWISQPSTVVDRLVDLLKQKNKPLLSALGGDLPE